MISELKEAREAAGYTIDQVAKKLNIRKQYLVAIEQGNDDIIPGKVYVKGYKKIYYEFLGINSNSQQANNSIKEQVLSSENKQNATKKYTSFITIFSIIFFVLVLALYNFLRSL